MLFVKGAPHLFGVLCVILQTTSAFAARPEPTTSGSPVPAASTPTASASPTPIASSMAVKLVPLPKGLAHDAVAIPMLAKESQRAVGPSFADPTQLPDVVAALGNNNFFYALFNTFVAPDTHKAYAIQRIKKTARDYRYDGDTHPTVSVEYLVEIFKLRKGEFKREDLHHGGYAMHGVYRREVTKELEIGTGEIPELATGDAWPFEPTILYKLAQDYGSAPGLYEKVRFERSVKWSIRASFTSDGKYELSSPALGVSIKH